MEFKSIEKIRMWVFMAVIAVLWQNGTAHAMHLFKALTQPRMASKIAGHQIVRPITSKTSPEYGREQDAYLALRDALAKRAQVKQWGLLCQAAVADLEYQYDTSGTDAARTRAWNRLELARRDSRCTGIAIRKAQIAVKHAERALADIQAHIKKS